MNITIVGAGNMARGIAARAVTGGHTVTITAQDPAKAHELAEALGARAGDDSAIDDADVIVLAVPYAAAKQLAGDYGARLSGKVVIDISNPVTPSLDGLVVVPGTSAAEEIAQAADAGASVVKAFNTTFASTLVAGRVADVPLDVFIAGDDEAARGQVAELVASGGLNPVDVGELHQARALEAFQLLHMSLQTRRPEYGWQTTIKLVAP